MIAELESTARNVYTGAIGFASPVAGLELSVAIRTFEFRDTRAWLGVGGGIVADSDPIAEAAECATKARPLLSAIGARLAGDDAERTPDAAPPAPLRVRPRPVRRPDPAAGVFETLLVADGRPVALERHLARLARSIGTLYRRRLTAGLAEAMVAAAWRVQQARLRVSYRPAADGFDVELTDLPERQLPFDLVPRTMPGGLGAHKWIDRRPLEALGGDGEPLLCDLDGLVLESARASVFAVQASGRLVTPPTDGRILPGVTRARVLELARTLGFEVRVRPIDLGELARASELFLTGSLGGVQPAQLDGQPPAPGTVTVQIAQALRGVGHASLAPA